MSKHTTLVDALKSGSLLYFNDSQESSGRWPSRFLHSSTYWASHMLIWLLLVFISNMLLNFSCVTTGQRHQQIICWQVKRFSVNQTRIYLAQNIVGFFYLTAQIPFTFLSLQSSSESRVCWLTLINTVCSEAGLRVPSEPLKISRTTIYMLAARLKKVLKLFNLNCAMKLGLRRKRVINFGTTWWQLSTLLSCSITFQQSLMNQRTRFVKKISQTTTLENKVQNC